MVMVSSDKRGTGYNYWFPYNLYGGCDGNCIFIILQPRNYCDLC